MEPLYVLVAGSRKFTDVETMYRVLDGLIDIYRKTTGGYSEVIIVHGGAKGADVLADEYAANRGYKREMYEADWDLYGFSAGFRRNEKMHKIISSHKNRFVVCFWHSKEKSKGTAHNFALCKTYNNTLFVWDFYTNQFIQK